MSKIERGVKRRCGSCEAPFYDMLRYPITCPKCGAVYDGAAGKKKLASVPRTPKGAAGKAAFAAKAKAAVKASSPVADEVAVAETESDEDAELQAEVEDIDAADEDEAEDDEPQADEPEDDGDDNVTGDH